MLLHLKLALVVVRILYVHNVINCIMLICEGERKIGVMNYFIYSKKLFVVIIVQVIIVIL